MLNIFENLANFIVFNLLKLSPSTKIGAALHFFIQDTTKIFFLLTIMMVGVSFFRSKLDNAKVRSYIENKHPAIAYILAVLLGSITPFCSCSSIPLFIGFVEAGIPFGVTMAFLITSPLVNEVAVVVFASTIGIKLAVIYVLTGMFVGVLGGFIMDRFGFEKYIEEYVFDIKVGKSNQLGNLSVKERFSYAINFASGLIKKIWVYILIGIGIGAVLHGYVPQSFFLKYTNAKDIFAVPIAVLLGIPLYSNATGVIPIAQALLSKGVPIGTVLALMMSIVAVSLPELIILRRVLKLRLIVYFVLFLLLAFVSIGYLYNIIL